MFLRVLNPLNRNAPQETKRHTSLAVFLSPGLGVPPFCVWHSSLPTSGMNQACLLIHWLQVFEEQVKLPDGALELQHWEPVSMGLLQRTFFDSCMFGCITCFCVLVLTYSCSARPTQAVLYSSGCSLFKCIFSPLTNPENGWRERDDTNTETRAVDSVAEQFRADENCFDAANVLLCLLKSNALPSHLLSKSMFLEMRLYISKQPLETFYLFIYYHLLKIHWRRWYKSEEHHGRM